MRYSCADCGHVHALWVSCCSVCNGSAVYVTSVREQRAPAENRLKRFAEIPAKQYPRHSTGFTNLDRILGGGLVAGSVVLVTGEPGAGKSTLMLQVLGALVSGGLSGAMIHAEESADQLAARAIYWEIASRDFYMIGERELSKAFASVPKLDILLADSLQTVYIKGSRFSEGSPNHIVESCKRISDFAHAKKCTAIIIGHVTKEGEMSGPQTLKHLVDVTLHLEFSETHDTRRNITAIKNRYGPSPYTLPLTMSAFGFRND